MWFSAKQHSQIAKQTKIKNILSQSQNYKKEERKNKE